MSRPTDPPRGVPAFTSRAGAALLLACGLIAHPAAAQPDNDQCAAAQAIGEGLFPFSTLGADTDGFVVACVGEDFTGSDVWFRYTASQTRRAIFDTCGSDFDTIITILDDCAGLELACSNDQCGQQSRVGYDVSAGQAYVVRVAGYFGASGQGALRVAFQSGPSNDACAQATPVGEGLFAFNTEAATTDGFATCGAGGANDVWFVYTPAASGLATFETCGANLDTVLSLFSSCEGAELACNDDACGTASRIATVVEAETPVFIRVAGFDGAVGSGTLRITLAGPPASCIGRPPGALDEPEPCGSALNNGCAGSGAGFTELACGETTVFGTAFTTGTERDADWYRFSIPGTATVTLTLQADFNATLTLASAPCPVGTLSTTHLARCSETGMIIAALAPGQYAIAVEMTPPVAAPCGSANNYVLTVAMNSCVATGACCSTEGCGVLTLAECASIGGTYLGDNVACTETVLDPAFTSNETPVAIPDVDSDTGTPGEVSIGLDIAGTGLIIPPEGIAVSLDLAHAGSGDLRFAINSAFQFVFFLDQIGLQGEDPRDDSDFAGTYRFFDSAPTDIWVAAAAAGPEQAIPPGDYQPRGIGGAPFSFGAEFAGLPLDGHWTLTVSDFGFGGVGSVNAFVIALTTSRSACDRCRADFNGDGLVDPDDLGDFINCYFAVPPCDGADFNGDGPVDPDDLGDFINVYFAGCP